MAPSLSNSKLLLASLTDALSFSLTRRGYATASEGSVAAGLGRRASRVGVMERRAAIKEESAASSSWALDPVKGYYRPQNCGPEIDPAELRELLLKNNVRPN